MTERTYKDKFTLDGKLKPGRGVTKASVAEAARLMGLALNGDYRADAELRHRVTATEAYTTSDLAPAVAYLVSLETIPQLEKPQYSVSELATTRTVKDFTPAVLYSTYGDLTGPGLDKNGAPVRIPEGSQYPTVTVTGQESFYTKLAKRGTRFDFTWESQISDSTGFFAELPGELALRAHDAEYAEVFDAIDSAPGSSALAGGVLPNGVTVTANSHISPDAIWEAKFEMANRTVNGRLIGEASGYNVLVPVGRKAYIDYQLNQQIVKVIDGNLELSGGSYYQGALGNITTIESPRVTGTQWKMLPKPGATVRPSLELLKLRGYETPELRVRQDGGDSSYDSDTKSFRLRMVVGGVLWDSNYVLTSTGAGA